LFLNTADSLIDIIGYLVSQSWY